MQRWWFLLISFVFLAVLGSRLSNSAESPRILQVAADSGAEFASVQEAVDAAPAGAVIRIGPGTFQGPVLINKPLTLEGAGAGKTFLTADWSTLEEVLVDGKGISPARQARYQELRKIAVDEEKGEGPVTAQLWKEFGPKPALTIESAQNVAIRGLSVSMPGTVWKGGWQDFSMVLLKDAGATLEQCAFVGSAVDGMEVTGKSAVTMRNCLVGGIRSSGVVLNLEAQSKVEIADCDVRGCGYAGIQHEGTGDVTISGCRISQIEFHGIRYDDASPTITGNVFSEINRAGIYLDGEASGSISDNLFFDCGIGGSQGTIQNNTFVRKAGSSPDWRDFTAIGSRGERAQLIRYNVIVGYDYALVLYSTDKQPLKRESKRFEQNLFETKKGALVNAESVEPKGFRGPRVKPEYHALPLPEGNWQMPIKFADPEHGDYSLSLETDWPDRNIGVRKHAAIASPWPEQPAERAMLDRIQEVEEQTR